LSQPFENHSRLSVLRMAPDTSVSPVFHEADGIANANWFTIEEAGVDDTPNDCVDRQGIVDDGVPTDIISPRATQGMNPLTRSGSGKRKGPKTSISPYA